MIAGDPVPAGSTGAADCVVTTGLVVRLTTTRLPDASIRYPSLPWRENVVAPGSSSTCVVAPAVLMEKKPVAAAVPR